MIQKQKKKIMYLLALVFGLFLTAFSIHKDETPKYSTKSIRLNEAQADTPYGQSGYGSYTQGRYSSYAQGRYYAQSQYYGQSSYGDDGDGDDGDGDDDDDGDSDGSDEKS